MDSNSNPESKLKSFILQISSFSESWNPYLGFDPEWDSISKMISTITQTISLVSSIDFDSQPESKLMSLTNEAVYVFNSMDLDSQPDPLMKLISLISQKVSLVNSTDLISEQDTDSAPDLEIFMLLIQESFSLTPEPELISLINQIISHVVFRQRQSESMPDLEAELEPEPDSEPESEPEIDLEMNLISLITQLISQPITLSLKIYLIPQIISMVSKMDFDLQPETEFVSLITQAVSLFKSMDLDSQPDPLRNLISLISEEITHAKSIRVLKRNQDLKLKLGRTTLEPMILARHFNPETDSGTKFLWRNSNSSTDSDTKLLELDSNSDRYVHIKPLEPDSNSDTDLDLYCKTMSLDSYLMSLVGETLRLEPEPKFISLIYQIFSLVISMNSVWKRLIFLYPQVQVKLEKGKFHVIEEVSWSSKGKWKCLPLDWKRIWITEEGLCHIHCQTCNVDNHGEYEKAPVMIKHALHPNHSLQLVLLNGDTTRECYCCDNDLEEVFYYCSTCDYAMNIACVEKPRVLSLDQPKWHEHTLTQFPRKTSVTCNVCSLAYSSCPFYICPPCDFVVHQKCLSLPRVIRISRHFHRIYFTLSFDQGVRCCGVCRRKIDNDYGGYSCKKDGCSYVAHSKCATQSNVWDGKELEGEPEEDINEIEPFVTLRDGSIRHFSHEHHRLKLDENTSRDYNENKLCQACITPIYFGNVYSCMQCDFSLHEECAKLSRKTHHPVHPHLLTLVGKSDIMDATKSCSVCPWKCTTGFFYECRERECRFKVHVQCATIYEPLVHESHMDPLFLTSKPGEERRCCVCKELGHCSTNETFNCIECDFALCFKCATLPHKVRYKHDKHMLTLSYGEETSTIPNWCEVCEKKIKSKERFYMCDEYCCVTLHIECMLGVDLYMKPGSFWFYRSSKVGVLPNNHHMSRPICSFCEKRCQHKIVFQCFGLISCSTSCIRVKESREMTKYFD
ncbi:putative chromatin regulator PHD family [Arabidopsis thaliana]|uniref:Cysteine/Histidine-rich C1 domain family protein n=1 Tax=Arabidopsis thaliana TaxID=3702 RepID=A0A178UXB1_ARATH|nr:hypothetical protein AXX17_AT4G17470 [Arabidopsis thaliana]